MKHILTTTAAAICLMSSAAFAAPSVMTDEQMDSLVAAGATTIENRGGNVIWTVTGLTPPAGTNNGGKGRTQNAAGGLLNAAGGLEGMANGKGLIINLHN